MGYLGISCRRGVPGLSVISQTQFFNWFPFPSGLKGGNILKQARRH